MDRSARAKRKRRPLFQLATESPMPNCLQSNSPGNSTSIQTSPQLGRMHERNRQQARPIGRVVEKPAIRSDCPFRKAIPSSPDHVCQPDRVRKRMPKDACRRPIHGVQVRGWRKSQRMASESPELQICLKNRTYSNHEQPLTPQEKRSSRRIADRHKPGTSFPFLA